MKIIVPKGFYEEALSENVMAGTAMGRRASYMYGLLLPRHAGGNIGTGLGTTNSRGKSMLVRPTDEIETTGERRVIDGLEMEFMFVPEAEAPGGDDDLVPEIQGFLCCRRNYAYDA